MSRLVITYDIGTDRHSQARLREVTRVLEGYGERVQYSVFEVAATPEVEATIKAHLRSVIDPKTDSVRIYRVTGHIETVGAHRRYAEPGSLIPLSR